MDPLKVRAEAIWRPETEAQFLTLLASYTLTAMVLVALLWFVLNRRVAEQTIRRYRLVCAQMSRRTSIINF